MKRIFAYWLPVILWAAIIFLFSANPDPYRYLPESWRSAVPLPTVSGSSLAEWIGQLMHFVEYAILAFLLARALFSTFPPKLSNSQTSKGIVNHLKNNGLTAHEVPLVLRRGKGIFRGEQLTKSPSKASGISLTVSLSMLFALSDEIHQLFVPGRAFQVVDLVIDFLGSLFGVFLFTRLKIKPQRTQRTQRKN